MSCSIEDNFVTGGYLIIRKMFSYEEIEELRHEVIVNRDYGFANAGGISIPDFVACGDVFDKLVKIKDNAGLKKVLRERVFNTEDFRFCGHNDIGINRVVGWHKDKLNGE